MADFHSRRNPPKPRLTRADELAEDVRDACEKARKELGDEQFEDFLMSAGMILEEYLK